MNVPTLVDQCSLPYPDREAVAGKATDMCVFRIVELILPWSKNKALLDSPQHLQISS